MGNTSIEWTEKVWNPVTGCSKVSAGCKNCYAERIFHRPYPGRAFTDVRCHEDRLEDPLHWRKPCRVFVNSMSDLFHESVPFEFILAVLAHAVSADRHTYQILTKRPERALEFFEWMDTKAPYRVEVRRKCFWWLVSVEDQPTADKRIPLLMNFPVNVRGVSVEPLLGPISFRWAPWDDWNSAHPKRLCGPDQCTSIDEHDGLRMLDWVIVGCESGPKARPMETGWARTIRDQCVAAKVPMFLKQMMIDGKLVSTPELDGQKWTQFPNV